MSKVSGPFGNTSIVTRLTILFTFYLVGWDTQGSPAQPTLGSLHISVARVVWKDLYDIKLAEKYSI